MFNSIVSGFHGVIHACAHKVREFKQCLMLETEVILDLQNSNNLFTWFLTPGPFKPIFCFTVPIGGVTSSILSFSKDSKAIFLFYSNFSD